MEYHNANLNVHYSTPNEIWNIIDKICQSMPAWLGYINHIPYWFGSEEDERFINASVEPSGIQFFAKMPADEWNEWLTLLKIRLTDALGYEIGEPEDGYEFKYYI